VSALYYVRSGNGTTMGAPRSYKKPNEAKQAARKKFDEYDKYLLAYDKAQHEKLKDITRAIDDVNADDARLGDQSDWFHATRDNPMVWELEVGWNVKLRVEMWKT
jgi:hypothetical protein